MKKQKIVILSGVILLGLVASVYQYIAVMMPELVGAADTKPANGHSWSEMESDSDSIQVLGRTITNLAAPVASTDATNKEYVDAAGGMVTYSTCYIVLSSTCASGFTNLAYTAAGSCWVFHSSIGGGASSQALITGVGGGPISFSFGARSSGSFVNDLCASYPPTYPAIMVNNVAMYYTSGGYISLCCK